jgi:nicastrin
LFVFPDPGREKVVAPIIRLKNSNELSQLSAVLLSVDEIEIFFARHV